MDVLTIDFNEKGCFQYSNKFCWKPEGHYHCTKFMVIAPFWFSMEHHWIVIVPFWLSTEDMITLIESFKTLLEI